MKIYEKFKEIPLRDLATLNTLDKLQKLLRIAANDNFTSGKMTDESQHNYFMSGIL